MLFAYRSGKNRITPKVWLKLDEAESLAGIGRNIPLNAESSGNLKDKGISESASVVREDPPVYNAQRVELPIDQRLARLESAIDRMTAGQERIAEALEALVKIHQS